MRIVTSMQYRGRMHELFQVNTINAHRSSTESVETPEYKAEKNRRIQLYKELVKQHKELGDD